MEVKFTSEEEMNLIYESGALCTIYTYPYASMPKDFSLRELKIAEEIEEAAKAIWGEGYLEPEYNSWADTTTRVTISKSLISDRFLDFCYSYVARDKGDRCVSCVVLDNLVEADPPYLGAFIVHTNGVIIEKALENFWLTHTSKWREDFYNTRSND